MNTIGIETLILDFIQAKPNATNEELNKFRKTCGISPFQFSLALKQLAQLGKMEFNFTKD